MVEEGEFLLGRGCGSRRDLSGRLGGGGFCDGGIPAMEGWVGGGDVGWGGSDSVGGELGQER